MLIVWATFGEIGQLFIILSGHTAHIPQYGKGVVVFLYINLWSYLSQPFYIIMAVVRYNHTPIYSSPIKTHLVSLEPII